MDNAETTQILEDHAVRLRGIETRLAVYERDTAHIDRRFDAIEKKQDQAREDSAKIQRWFLFTIGAVVLSYLSKFILDGGLSIAH